MPTCMHVFFGAMHGEPGHTFEHDILYWATSDTNVVVSGLFTEMGQHVS